MSKVCQFHANHTPFAFDFVHQLLNLKMMEKVFQESISVSFRPKEKFEPVFGRGKAAYVDTIMRPLMRMFDVTEVDSDQIDYGTPEYNISTWAEAYRVDGSMPPRWHSPTNIGQHADNLITITLREASHQEDRNSRLEEWIKVADWLEHQGYEVVFVRDTEKAEETISGYTISPEASLDLLYRGALYESAKMNLFTANGPAALCTVTNDIPYLMMVQQATVSMLENMHHGFFVMDIGPYHPKKYNEADQWTAWHGFPKGENMPWASPKQRWAWGEDTFPVITKHLEEMLNV